MHAFALTCNTLSDDWHFYFSYFFCRENVTGMLQQTCWKVTHGQFVECDVFSFGKIQWTWISNGHINCRRVSNTNLKQIQTNKPSKQAFLLKYMYKTGQNPP